MGQQGAGGGDSGGMVRGFFRPGGGGEGRVLPWALGPFCPKGKRASARLGGGGGGENPTYPGNGGPGVGGTKPGGRNNILPQPKTEGAIVGVGAGGGRGGPKNWHGGPPFPLGGGRGGDKQGGGRSWGLRPSSGGPKTPLRGGAGCKGGGKKNFLTAGEGGGQHRGDTKWAPALFRGLLHRFFKDFSGPTGGPGGLLSGQGCAGGGPGRGRGGALCGGKTGQGPRFGQLSGEGQKKFGGLFSHWHKKLLVRARAPGWQHQPNTTCGRAQVKAKTKTGCLKRSLGPGAKKQGSHGWIAGRDRAKKKKKKKKRLGNGSKRPTMGGTPGQKYFSGAPRGGYPPGPPRGQGGAGGPGVLAPFKLGRDNKKKKRGGPVRFPVFPGGGEGGWGGVGHKRKGGVGPVPHSQEGPTGPVRGGGKLLAGIRAWGPGKRGTVCFPPPGAGGGGGTGSSFFIKCAWPGGWGGTGWGGHCFVWGATKKTTPGRPDLEVQWEDNPKKWICASPFWGGGAGRGGGGGGGGAERRGEGLTAFEGLFRGPGGKQGGVRAKGWGAKTRRGRFFLFSRAGAGEFRWGRQVPFQKKHFVLGAAACFSRGSAGGKGRLSPGQKKTRGVPPRGPEKKKPKPRAPRPPPNVLLPKTLGPGGSFLGKT